VREWTYPTNEEGGGRGVRVRERERWKKVSIEEGETWLDRLDNDSDGQGQAALGQARQAQGLRKQASHNHKHTKKARRSNRVVLQDAPSRALPITQHG